MKKLKNITATEALRLMRLGFSDKEIIEADSEMSESASISNVKQKRQSVKKEKQRQKKVVDDNSEEITAKEILRKIEEIKEKHSAAVKKVENFIQKDKKKTDNLLEKKEIEIKTSSTTDVEDISQQDVDF